MASTRDRIVAAAVEMTTSSGWAAVTMARLAEAVGVSRQTVYNEVGSKPALAEAMVLEELARTLAGRVKLVRVDVDRAPATAARFGVQGIPTMLVLRDGEVVARQTGAASQVVLGAWLDGALGPVTAS